MESRKNFFADEFVYKRMESKLEDVVSTLTLEEVLRMIREISYDMVCYYNDAHKGIIYSDKNGKYSKINIEQACRLQRLLSTACDLFGQSVINHREFEEGYLEKWTDGGYLQNKVAELENKIKKLEDELYDRTNE